MNKEQRRWYENLAGPQYTLMWQLQFMTSCVSAKTLEYNGMKGEVYRQAALDDMVEKGFLVPGTKAGTYVYSEDVKQRLELVDA